MPLGGSDTVSIIHCSRPEPQPTHAETVLDDSACSLWRSLLVFICESFILGTFLFFTELNKDIANPDALKYFVVIFDVVSH